MGKCPELSHSSPDVAQAHPTRVADRSAHSLKALYVPGPMPSVPPKCCSSSGQHKGCQRGNKTGREELLGTGRGLRRGIQQTLPEGKATPIPLPTLMRESGGGADGDPALLHHLSSMAKGTRTKTQGGLGEPGLQQTQTHKQTDKWRLPGGGPWQAPPLTRHPSLDSWPVLRPHRAGSRRPWWLV